MGIYMRFIRPGAVMEVSIIGLELLILSVRRRLSRSAFS